MTSVSNSWPILAARFVLTKMQKGIISPGNCWDNPYLNRDALLAFFSWESRYFIKEVTSPSHAIHLLISDQTLQKKLPFFSNALLGRRRATAFCLMQQAAGFLLLSRFIGSISNSRPVIHHKLIHFPPRIITC